MKKLLAISCALFVFSNSAFATGLFIGGDALFANSRQEAKNSSTSSGPKNGDVQDAEKFSYGVNAGVRLDLLNLLVSAEVFYDNIQASSRDFSLNNGSFNGQDSLRINDRYGAKANVGFALLPRITPFVTYGWANVNYSSVVASSGRSLKNSELTPLYGVGLLVDLPLGVSVKAGYDYQSFSARHAANGAKTRSHLGIARLGVIYNF